MDEPTPSLPEEPTERILEQAYFHIADGGLKFSIIEVTGKSGYKTYRFKHVLSNFGVTSESSFPLGSSDIVSWLTMALNRVSMHVTGSQTERSWQPFEKGPGTISVKNGIPIKQAALTLRVAARYLKSFEQQGFEFSSPEALREYLKEHPGADKTKHHVKKPDVQQPKPEAPPAEKPKAEHEESADQPKKTFKERLQSLSQKAKSFLSNAPTEIKKFVSDDAHRRGVLQSMHKSLEALPDKVYQNAKHAIKHEAHEFKTAGQGIKAVLKGEKMTKEQKKAVKMVAFDVALTVATAAVTGGLGAGLKGLAAKTAESFTKALAKKLALNTVTHGLGNLVTVEELGHFGHGITHVLEHVVHAAEAPKGDDRDLMTAYITKLVADQLKDLDPDVLAEALEEASGEAA
jgi:predicted RNA-binding protein with TRAM domain